MKFVFELLTFRRMISPVILQVLFWGAIGGVLYGTYVLLILDNWAWPFSLIFGVLAVRIIFELGILAFRTYDRLGEILRALESR